VAFSPAFFIYIILLGKMPSLPVFNPASLNSHSFATYLVGYGFSPAFLVWYP